MDPSTSAAAPHAAASGGGQDEGQGRQGMGLGGSRDSYDRVESQKRAEYDRVCEQLNAARSQQEQAYVDGDGNSASQLALAIVELTKQKKHLERELLHIKQSRENERRQVQNVLDKVEESNRLMQIRNDEISAICAQLACRLSAAGLFPQVPDAVRRIALHTDPKLANVKTGGGGGGGEEEEEEGDRSSGLFANLFGSGFGGTGGGGGGGGANASGGPQASPAKRRPFLDVAFKALRKNDVLVEKHILALDLISSDTLQDVSPDVKNSCIAMRKECVVRFQSIERKLDAIKSDVTHLRKFWDNLCTEASHYGSHAAGGGGGGSGSNDVGNRDGSREDSAPMQDER